MLSHENHVIRFTPEFGDKRLNVRFRKIVEVKLQEMECSIPQAFKQWSQVKAVYRFMSNKKVNPERILASQFNSFPEKDFSQSQLVLAVHDTTELDFTGKSSDEQLGCLSYENKKGFFLHNTLLLTNEGIPTAVFHQHYWNRQKATLGKKKERKHLPIEQKESYRWIEGFERVSDHFKNKSSTTVINICDREGDIYELLQVDRPRNCHYIIRSCNNRRVENVEDSQHTLWERVNNTPVQGTYRIEVTDQKIRQKRMSTIEVKWLSDVVLTAPYRKNEKSSPISVNIIYAREINAPKDTNAVDWKLLTSLSMKTIDEALTIIRYYNCRWRIERFHYVLKQGCGVEGLQLEQEHNLKNAISLYSLIACKLLAMMYLSREQPQASVYSIGFTHQQYVWLYTYLETFYHIKIDKQTKKNSTIEHFIKLVGTMGGYQKHNKPHPGVKVLWRGMKELLTILNCFALLPEKRYG